MKAILISPLQCPGAIGRAMPVNGSTGLRRTAKQAKYSPIWEQDDRLSHAAGASFDIAGNRCCGVVVARHAGGADACADRWHGQARMRLLRTISQRADPA